MFLHRQKKSVFLMTWALAQIFPIAGDQVGVNGINGAGPTNWQAKKVSYNVYSVV